MDHDVAFARATGRDFDASDEDNVRELAALIGETLDALRRGANPRSESPRQACSRR
jgi:hypothetical protein